MAHKMTDEEWKAFVSEGTRTAKLATVRADGTPHIAPVWFVVDGDDIVFNTGKDTVKGRNLARDGHVAICVDDERPPFSFVTIRGRAELSEDPAELLDSATRIGGRYMGADRAEEFGRRNGVPGELVVRVRVEKVVALGDVAD
ncbi:PPOX class F420-dependent oxidoreductase [Streptomyces sp. KL116D]|uniref:PPOX class F420-dependent oxidoreductase n=1 Tax=Streptomyces sp. KL116D TaxID=3045152 RepID=UPI003558528B